MITGGRESSIPPPTDAAAFQSPTYSIRQSLEGFGGKDEEDLRSTKQPVPLLLIGWGMCGVVVHFFFVIFTLSLSVFNCECLTSLIPTITQRGSMATRPRAGKNQIFDWSQRLVDWNFWPFYCFPQLPNDSISSSYVPERRCVVVVVVSTGGRLPTPPQRALSAGRITQAVIYNSLPLLFQHPSALPSIYRWILLRVRHGVARSGGPSFFKTFVQKFDCYNNEGRATKRKRKCGTPVPRPLRFTCSLIRSK